MNNYAVEKRQRSRSLLNVIELTIYWQEINIR